MIFLLRWTAKALWFPVAYAAWVLAAAARVCWDILTPGSASVPAFVEIPLRCRTELEVTGIANMVSLTPGTVTVAIRMAPPTIWVHGMYAEDDAGFRDGIHAMEDRLLELTRLSGAPARIGPGEGSVR